MQLPYNSRAVIWFTSYCPNLSFVQLTAQGGLLANTGSSIL